MWSCSKYRKHFNTIDRWHVIATFEDGAKTTDIRFEFSNDPKATEIQGAIDNKLASINSSNSIPQLSLTSPISLSIESDKERLKWLAINAIKDDPAATTTVDKLVAETAIPWQDKALLTRMVFEYSKQLHYHSLAEIDVNGTLEDMYTALHGYISATNYEELTEVLAA